MFKSRIKIYAMALLIVLIIENFAGIGKVFINLFKDNTISVSVYTDDEILLNMFNEPVKLDNYKLSYREKNSDLIITHKTLNNKDYQKLNVQLYTPIILFTDSDGLSRYDIPYGNSGCDYKYVNYKNVIDCVINDGKAEEYGLRSDNKIVLNLVTDNSSYYDAISKTIYYSATGKNEATKEEIEEYMKNFESKTNKINNLVSFSRSLKDYEFFFGPEMLTNYWNEIYDTESIVYTYNVYIKKDRTDKAELLNIFSTEDLYKKLRLRSDNANYDKEFDYIKKNLSVVEFTEMKNTSQNINKNEEIDTQ